MMEEEDKGHRPDMTAAGADGRDNQRDTASRWVWTNPNRDPLALRG